MRNRVTQALTWGADNLLRVSPLLPLYVALAVLGHMYTFGSLTAVTLTAEANKFGGYWWPLSLIIAAYMGALGGLNLKWRKVPVIWSILLEAVGSTILVYVLASYAFVLIGPKAPTFTVYLAFGAGCACWCRCLQQSIIFIRLIRELLNQQRRA